ncbi:MAG: DUF1801 domain-containing protein [Devosia sp.]|uniref:DUF1801 domain-containing protein n=1 Tax=Devosia sp. TaxID=1871048 RepID=UPI0024CB174F|nr:DUF1801 domain-containing protein [Devosia sp.]UYO00269.1 MAG: DUF1801 domain-containing protein [Devosia sp.]
MAEQKTKPHTGDVTEFLLAIEGDERRADAQQLVTLMEEVSGEPAVLWGTMVGFGHYHYKYPTGHEGDSFLVGFSPRKNEFSIYLMGTYFPSVEAERTALLARLGKHRMGKACLYVKRLSAIDMDVLRELAEISVRTLRNAYPAT